LTTRISPGALVELSEAARLRLLVGAVSDYAIYLLDTEGNVATWNPGAQRFKGYTSEEIIGRHFSAFYTEEDRAAGKPAAALATAAQTGRFESEGWRVRKDGTRFWTHAVIDAVRGEDGAIVGFAKVTRDISDKRAADEALAAARAELERSREALAQAQKMEAIGRLTGGVAHDFNNLLTVIRSSADFLRRPNLDEARRMRYVEAIAETAQRATVLTGQLLAFARRQPLQPMVFDVCERLRGLQQIIETSVGGSVRVTLATPSTPLLVDADPSQFETAVLNIIINARDAMPGGGAITLTAWAANSIPPVRNHVAAEGEFVAVSIADTGQGMDEDVRSRIFEPFFTTKPVDKGTGLGLSQVYGFAKQSKGEIDVASEKGQGAAFTLYLPAALREAGPEEPARALPAVDLPARSVLLVEDNQRVGAFARDLLQELGQSVVWAGDGKAALRLLQAGRSAFDLVFTDVVMPGMSGIELAREIRGRWPDLPVVLTSGYSHVLAEDADHGFPLLKKPYSVDDLFKILQTPAILIA